MQTITGVFRTRADAARAFGEIHKVGIPVDKVTFLTPGSEQHIEAEVGGVPTDAVEQPGMGKAIGALAGGGVGLAGGALLVSLIPGVGPISAVGLLGAAILGAAGATAGATVGGKAEESSIEGLPEDEIFVYEDALRRGFSVVVVLAENEELGSTAREILERQGAESINAAREEWWIGLRSAEKEHYETTGGNFPDDEKFYRLGFEAALHARMRCREFDQVSAEMDAALEEVEQEHPGARVEAPFTQGYQRGREYYQQLCDEKREAA